MRKNLPVIVILSMILATALIAFSCGPADTVTTGSLAGRITVDGAVTGNIGFMVAIAGTDFLAVTDDVGDFEITDIPAGSGYTLYISPPANSTVEPVHHEPTFTVIMGQTTDAGTIDLDAVATRTVTMTITNIPSQYGSAVLRFYNITNVQYFAQETIEIYSNQATVSGGRATMSLDIPLEAVDNLEQREVTLSIILFPTNDPETPSTFVSWKAVFAFLYSNTLSYNSATEEGNFVLSVPGLAESDACSFKGVPSWGGAFGVQYYHTMPNGSRTAYMGYVLSAFDNLISEMAANGDDFIFLVWPYPDYVTVAYTWNDIRATLAFNTLTTLTLADADTRTKEISITITDADADTLADLSTETSMTVRTGTIDTSITPSTGFTLYVDATAWDAMMASGFTVSITLADTVYTWSDVFTNKRIYLSFLDAVETPAP